MMGKRAPLILIGIAVNGLLILMLVQSLLQLPGSPSRFDLRVLREESGDVLFGDLNGDGRDDVLQLDAQGPFPRQRMLHVISPFLPAPHLKYRYFFETPVPAAFRIAGLGPLEESGRPVISFFDFDGSKGSLRTLDTEGNPVGLIPLPDIDPRPNPDTGFPMAALEDLNADGHRDLVLAVNSSYSGTPRGIVAYDLRNKRILWQYLCGFSPTFLRIIDINRDGRKEIILGGWSPHNGVSVNGTDDDHSYLILLDAAGKEMAKQVLGGYYTKVYFDISDINGDGSLEIVSSKGTHGARLAEEPGEIRILKGATLETLKYVQDSSVGFSAIRAMAFGSGAPLFVVGDSAGRVSVFDSKLELRRRITLDAPAVVRGAIGLGQGGRHKYLFVQTGFNKLWILTPRLRKVKDFPLTDFAEPAEAVLWEIHDGTRNAALISAGRLYLLSIREGFIGGVWAVLSSWPAGFLLLLILFNILFLVVMRRGLAESSIAAPVAGQVQWSEAAQEIVHRMKSALFTIQLEAEKLKSTAAGKGGETESDILKSSSSIVDDVADLKRKIRSVMKLLEMRQPETVKVDLAAVIGRTVKRYEELLKDKVEFRLDLDRDTGQLELDEGLFTEALSNIIENSVEALPRGGWIKITLTAIYSPVFRVRKAVDIEVEDNGIGIPASKLEQIFQPYYSTKKDGAGIGLPIARRVIEAHGGRLSVQSKEGGGTRFAIILPWKG